MGMILGFKPLRIYDLTNENLLIALPSGFMSFVPIFFALLFQTLVPTALQITLQLMTGLEHKPNSVDSLEIFDGIT